MALAILLKVGILAAGAYWIWSRTQGLKAGSKVDALDPAPTVTPKVKNAANKRIAGRLWTAAKVCLVVGIAAELTNGIADPIIPGATWVRVCEIGGYVCLAGGAILAAASGWVGS